MAGSFSRNQSFVVRRNEKERVLFIAAAGLAFSLLIIMLVVLNYKQNALAGADLRTPTASEPPAAMGTLTLYVADRDIPQGTKLSEITFKEVYWPRNQVPAEAILDPSELKNQYAKVNIAPNVPIQRGSLTTTPGSVGLPLTPGFRAVTIDVDATSSIEGYTLPGTIVDVVLTYSDKQGDGLTSKILVEAARVLSYGGTARPTNPRLREAPTLSSTITLEVTTEDALKIRTAAKMGSLSLMLRDGGARQTGSQNNSVSETDINSNNSIKTKGDCIRGKVKMNGREFLVDCKDQLTELLGNQEP